MARAVPKGLDSKYLCDHVDLGCNPLRDTVLLPLPPGSPPGGGVLQDLKNPKTNRSLPTVWDPPSSPVKNTPPAPWCSWCPTLGKAAPAAQPCGLVPPRGTRDPWDPSTPWPGPTGLARKKWLASWTLTAWGVLWAQKLTRVLGTQKLQGALGTWVG